MKEETKEEIRERARQYLENLGKEEVKEITGREAKVKPEEKKQGKRLEDIETPEMDKLINISMILAIIVGIGVTAALIYYTEQESYSDLYIYPDSYSNYVESDTVSFTYGVRSFETEQTRYELKVFLGEQLVNEKEFVLEKGGKKEETLSINVPYDTQFPVKVRIEVKMNNRENSVHFWLKGRK